MKTLVTFSITFVCLLVQMAALAETQTAVTVRATVGNKLQPFTSDGCSWFPDGLLVTQKNKWLHCCIQHDIAYWKGGTSKERKTADQNLGLCVGRTGAKWIGLAMALGVRSGGAADLPTTFHWGYGWAQNRGYTPLNEDEQVQVAALTPQMNSVVSDLKIETAPLITPQPHITKSLCLDQAIVETEKFLGNSFELLNQTAVRTTSPESTVLKLSLEVARCKNPLNFEFLLLKEDACETASTVLGYRAHVILRTPKLQCEPRS